MNHSDTINELATALAKAQAAMPVVKRDKTANIESNKGSYSYSYADLASVLEAIRKPLSDNGLAVIQTVETEPGRIAVETMLAHTSGQWITHSIAFAAANDPRSTGTAITYGRRYGLAITGVVTEDDDDGASAGSHAGQKLPERVAPVSAGPVPNCPKCGGPMWDNREKIKTSGKRMPEFSCKAGKWNAATKTTDGCDGVIWPRDAPAERMEDAGRPVLPEPSEPPPSEDFGGWPSAGDAPVTEVQRKAMFAEAKKVYGANTDEFRAWIHEQYKVESTNNLTMRQAIEITDLLRKQQP